MPGRAKTETALVQEILAAYGARADLMIWRNNTGAARARTGRLIRFGTPGEPDILGVCYRCFSIPSSWSAATTPPYIFGQAIAIEAKGARGRQTKRQKAWQQAFEKVGGIYILAKTVDDVAEILGASDD